MPVDIGELLPTFIEESLENLDEMEESLLALDPNAIDMEKINQIFRLAHTLKGNSAIFNFSGISNLAHASEALLDRVRNNHYPLERTHIQLLLSASDCIRSILLEIKQKKVSDEHCAEKIKNALTQILENTKTFKTPLNSATTKKPPEQAEEFKPKSLTTSIRVETEKIDNLMNSVGELVVIESALKQVTKEMDPKKARQLQEKLDELERNSRRLQERVLRIRMVPIAFAINRFPRMVSDIAYKLGKEVDLTIQGEQTEIDKTMIEKMTDPLMHLIRNAIDHGIEPPEVRKERGKTPRGIIQLNAYQEGGNIIIEIIDNGAGLDMEKIRSSAIAKGIISKEQKLNRDECYHLIFQPGFSTTEKVTDISGRGVGLDVVLKNINALGGSIEVESDLGIGTTFRLQLPLTLAIMDCQLLKVGDQIFSVPLINIVEMAQLDPSKQSYQEDKKEFYLFHDENIELISLSKVLSVKTSNKNSNNQFLIAVKINNKLFALKCDELLSQQQVVIKSIEENYYKIQGVAGAAIMGDGEITLILDVKEIIDIAHDNFYKLENVSETFNFQEDSPKEGYDSQDGEYLCFMIENREYGFNIKDIEEISTWKNTVTLPFLPPFILGIINFRGIIIPVMDLRKLFLMETYQYGPLNMIIVISIKNNGKILKHVGIAVDSIMGSQIIRADEISAVPNSRYLFFKKYIQGFFIFKEKLITLLSVQNLVMMNSGKGELE